MGTLYTKPKITELNDTKST